MKIDVSEIKTLIPTIEGMEEAIHRAEYRAVNKVADKTNTRSRRAITTLVNLSDKYVRDRMKIQYARPGYAVAEITGRGRGTTLTTYGARQVTESAPKAKGNARLGIPKGRKAAGISVSVKPGSRKVISSAFFMPLKNQNGMMGVFTRSAGSKPKHRLGPSIDQTFTLVIRDIKDEVGADLEATYAKQLEYELR